MKNKISNYHGCLVMAILCFLANAGLVYSAPMASQKWTENYVTNKIDSAKDELKSWTKGYISGTDFPEVDKDKEMWLDGTNLCVKVNGVIKYYPLSSVSQKPLTYGFFVSDCNFEEDGVISNGMFYADVDNDTYQCPANKRIPEIKYTHTITQTVEGVSYEYKKFEVNEYVTSSNGVVTIVKWNTLQQDEYVWKVYKRVETPDGNIVIKQFFIQYSKGTALPTSPIVSRFFNKSNKSDGCDKSILDIISEIFFPTALALDLDIDTSTMSMTLSIYSYNAYGQRILIKEVVGWYRGDMALWGKNGIVKSEADTVWTEKETDSNGDEYTVTKTRSPSVYPTIESFKNLRNWFEDSYAVEFTDYADDGLGNLTPFTVTTVISLGEIYRTCGKQIDEVLNSWIEPAIITLKKEKDENCEDGWHTYVDNTCVCKLCSYIRGHHLVEDENNKNGCLICDFPLGVCYLKTKNVKDGGKSKCNGRGNSTESHRGWHADPYSEFVYPPNSEGDRYQCVCQCGYFGLQNNNQHTFAETYSFITAGDLFGKNKNQYHTKMYDCMACSGSGSEAIGWIAKQESHKIDDTDMSGAFPCYIETDDEGNPKPVLLSIPNGCYISAQGGSVFQPDGDGRTPDELYHMAKGVCEECEERVDGVVQHNFNGGCVCQCGVQIHTWDVKVSENCPNAAYCKLCSTWFYRDDDGFVYFNSVNEDKHEFAVQFEELDMVNHHCKCWKQVKQRHNFEQDPENPDQKICSDPATETLDENGNVIRGCGLPEHTQETCPCKDVVGTCGDWSCRVCGKKLTRMNIGTEQEPSWKDLPTTHGSFDEGVSSYGYEENYKGVASCAYCNHYGSRRCGYERDGEGGVRFEGYEIPDWKCHVDWSTENRDLTESEKEDVHVCKCKSANYGRRSHNWGTRTATRILIDGVVDLVYHNAEQTCNAKDLQQYPYEDNCGYNFVGIDTHNYHSSYPEGSETKLFRVKANNPKVCQYQMVCRTYNDKDENVGCGVTKWVDTTHHFVANNSAQPYVLNDGSISKSQHWRSGYCQHTDAYGVGCGTIMSNLEAHVYSSVNEWMTTPLTVDDEGKIDKPGTHWQKKICSSIEGQPGCGATFNVSSNSHNLAKEHNYRDNHYHSNYATCESIGEDGTQCPYQDIYYGSSEHDGWGVRPAEYQYDGDGLYANHHNGIQNCSTCNHSFFWPYKERCEYDWVGARWTLGEEYDTAQCGYCDHVGRVGHKFVYFDSEQHYCKNGEGHLYEDHEMVWYNDVDATDGGYCKGCDYMLTPMDEAEIRSKKGCVGCYATYAVNFIEGEGEDITIDIAEEPTDEVCSDWNNETKSCDCRNCKNNRPQYCECCASGYDPRDISIPFGCDGNGEDTIYESQFMYVLQNYTNFGQIDGTEPVIVVLKNGFYGAFMNNPNLWLAKFGLCEYAADSAFEVAFSNCVTFETAEFFSLTNVGNRAFYGAWQGSQCLSSLQFPILERTGTNGFDSAIKDTNLFSWMNGFGGLKTIDPYGFANCNTLSEIRLPSVTNIEEYAFANCTMLNFLYLNTVTSMPRLASVNAFENVPYVKIIVPDSLYDEFVSDAVWGQIADRIVNRSGGSDTSMTKPTRIFIDNIAWGDKVTVSHLESKEGVTWDWGDGTVISNVTQTPLSHMYMGTGPYTIVIDGEMDVLGLTNAVEATLNNNGKKFYYGTKLLVVNGYRDQYVEDGTNIYRHWSGATNKGIVKKAIINNLRKLGNYAFASEFDLERVYCDTVESIGACAFHTCSNLIQVSALKAKYVGEGAFVLCNKLPYLSLPEYISPLILEWDRSVEEIIDCEELVELNMPKTKYLPLTGSMWYIPKVRSISMPKYIGQIGRSNGGLMTNNVFTLQSEECSNINLPNFKGDVQIMSDSLVNLYLPSVTGRVDASLCENLQTINLPAVKLLKGDFSDTPKLGSVVVASDCRLSEELNFGSSGIRKLPCNKGNIGYGTFSNCNRLNGHIELLDCTNIDIDGFRGAAINSITADSVTNVGDNAFCEWNLSDLNPTNTSLRSVTMIRVKKLGYNAFMNCVALANVVMPSLERIDDSGYEESYTGEGVFCGCKITDEFFEYNYGILDYIGRDAFSNCLQLENVVITASHIGTRAFYCEKRNSDFRIELNSAELPEIGDDAFYRGNANLYKVEIYLSNFTVEEVTTKYGTDFKTRIGLNGVNDRIVCSDGSL